MTVMLVGGGTGGHIMPLLAVAHELKISSDKIKIIAVIDKSTKFGHLLESSRDIDRVERVSAGKFRRYPNESWLQKLLDVKTAALNIRDFGRTIVGIIESLRLISRTSPDVIFIKGGLVAVPIGAAARIKKVKFVTHDSDAQPGLANRLIARWAVQHLVGMPTESYSYPPDKTVQVGIPVSKDYAPVSSKQHAAFRKEVDVPLDAKMILITGGSQGAQQINNVVSDVLDQLLQDKDMYIVHQTGANSNDLPVSRERYNKVDYITNLQVYAGAADVVITRAGSSLAELARQAKACIVIPAPHLAGNHQIKNAQLLSQHNAAMVLDEVKLVSKPNILVEAVEALVDSPAEAQQLGTHLQQFYPDKAAKSISGILLSLANKA